MIFRVTDDLPLAASVDDESVSLVIFSLHTAVLIKTTLRTGIDGERPRGTETAIKTGLQATYGQKRTSVFDRKWKVHFAVSHFTIRC
jgi:hypothetical protein